MQRIWINTIDGLRGLAIIALLLGSSALFAEQRQVQLDPANVKVQFTLGDVLHTVKGQFQLKSGNIQFDPSTGAANGDIVIDAASGNSGNKARDKKMHKENLESQRYPTIEFLPQHITGNLAPQGASNVQVAGIFRMHGMERPLIMNVALRLTGDRLSAATQFPLRYEDWGIKNPSTFILRVSDTVKIDISASGTVTAAAATAAGK